MRGVLGAMKISVFGIGYVGLANAVLLAGHNDVIACDISSERVAMLNKRVSPIKDAEIEQFLREESLSLSATSDKSLAYNNPDYILVATPTDYDPDKQFFNTASVELVIAEAARLAPSATIIVKSTVPIGFTDRMRNTYPALSIMFAPEFLREGEALYDNLYPSRIIIGDSAVPCENAKTFAALILQCIKKKDAPLLYMPPAEAEAVKLFANTYLALRVAYFNELDTFAELRGLDAKAIIEGVCLDPRIGAYYNNPSFGYGGYCLPKDTKQIMANYKGIPNDIISAIVAANDTRKTHITNMILSKKPKTAGIYKLAMKANSDNARSSAILNIIERLKETNIDIIIFDPSINVAAISGCELIKDFDEFQTRSDIIIANRISDELKPYINKVYSRDIFADN
jgi:UDPglucose 6-dehydrogenase